MHGVVERLLLGVQPEGWTATGRIEWKHLRKMRAKGPTPREERNVLALVLEAKRGAAHVLAFVRDADGDPERAEAIDAALRTAREEFPEIEVIGAAAVPVLEGWMLALLGESGTERLGKTAAQSKLREKGIPLKDTPAMVKVVTESSLERVPQDAVGLRGWLSTAREVLPRRVREASTEA
jgi:hypothetical protein